MLNLEISTHSPEGRESPSDLITLSEASENEEEETSSWVM